MSTTKKQSLITAVNNAIIFLKDSDQVNSALAVHELRTLYLGLSTNVTANFDNDFKGGAVQAPPTPMSEQEWSNFGKEKLSLLIKDKVTVPVVLFDIYPDCMPEERLFDSSTCLKLQQEVNLALNVLDRAALQEKDLFIVLPRGGAWITLFIEGNEKTRSILDLTRFAYMPHALSVAIDYLQKYISELRTRAPAGPTWQEIVDTSAGINGSVDMSSARPSEARIGHVPNTDTQGFYYNQVEAVDNYGPDVKMTVEGMTHSECGVSLDFILPDRALLRSVVQVVEGVSNFLDDRLEADATQAIVFSVLYDYLSKQVQAGYAVEGAARNMLDYCEAFANRFSHQKGLTSDSAMYVTIEHGENGLPASMKVICNRPDIVYALDLTQFRFEYAAVYFVLSTLINNRLYLKDHLLAMEVEHAVNVVTSRTDTPQ